MSAPSPLPGNESAVVAAAAAAAHAVSRPSAVHLAVQNAQAGVSPSADSLAGAGGEKARDLLEHASAVGAAAEEQHHLEDLWGITCRLISAKSLKVADLFTRSSDPYCKLTLDGAPGSLRTSRVVKHSLAPEWGETFTWLLSERPKQLRIDVYDWDQVGKHDKLGFLEFPLSAVTDGHSFAGELPLTGKHVRGGTVNVRLECTRVPNVVGRSTAELRGVKDIDDISALIDLKLVGACNLDQADSSARKIVKGAADPYAVVKYGLHAFKTATVSSNNDPTWCQLCPLWMTKSDFAATTVLKIAVYDYESIGASRLIGSAYLRPGALEMGKLHDLHLPLTKQHDENDAQLGVLMREMNLHSPVPPASPQPNNAAAPAASAAAAAAPAVESNVVTAMGTAAMQASSASTAAAAALAVPSATPAHPTGSSSGVRGEVHVQLTLKPRAQVEEEFYSHMISDYDSDGNRSMDLVEVAHMLAALGVKGLSEEDVERSFAQADTEKKGGLGPKELAVFFRTPALQQNAGLRRLYAVITHGPNALDSLLMSSALPGSNANAAPDADPTVDNEGTRILVQDRESGIVVRENIPAYIKSALVLLNRTWAGKLASQRIRGTLRSLTRKAGTKMDSPNSARDIPNFVKVHQLNIDEVELPLSEYKTFNQFFSRRLKASARSCASPGDEAHAVSPADCRMMVFNSLDDATRLWIKGKHFTLGNLFGDWDKDGTMASRFNGGSLCIARLAPQDYHRFHSPVTGTLGLRHLLGKDYLTVSPIAVRKVDVYTENKRVIVPIHTEHFGLVLFIAVAATMVGSIRFDCTCNPPPADGHCCEDGRCQVGRRVEKFTDLGCFAFGGSTTLVLFQPGSIHFDNDLMANSGQQLETLVKVGTSLGRATGKFKK